MDGKYDLCVNEKRHNYISKGMLLKKFCSMATKLHLSQINQ